MMPKRLMAAVRGVFAMAAAAALLGGCVIATDSQPLDWGKPACVEKNLQLLERFVLAHGFVYPRGVI